jgi:hypothetical protein
VTRRPIVVSITVDAPAAGEDRGSVTIEVEENGDMKALYPVAPDLAEDLARTLLRCAGVARAFGRTN